MKIQKRQSRDAVAYLCCCISSRRRSLRVTYLRCGFARSIVRYGVGRNNKNNNINTTRGWFWFPSRLRLTLAKLYSIKIHGVDNEPFASRQGFSNLIVLWTNLYFLEYYIVYRPKPIFILGIRSRDYCVKSRIENEK